MGINQSDEYCETYERFMEEYDKGKPLKDITKNILDEYFEEFAEDDGVFHDVYFALGKAEWMCGGVSESVFQRITHIIKNDENISFLKELEATQVQLKTRKRNLEKFLQTLSVPRAKVKKRKIPEEKYIPEPKVKYIPLPVFGNGDVFAYYDSGTYRIFAVVRQSKAYTKGAYRKIAFCYMWKKTFSSIPTTEELFNEHIMPLGYFDGDTFPKAENLNFVGNIPELSKLGALRTPDQIRKEWNRPVFIISLPDEPPCEYDIELCLTLNEVLDTIEHL